jgi:TonB-linked SusC/RagA family outer membrane protein
LALVVAFPAFASSQQPVTVTGRVTDETGQALTVANITIPELNMIGTYAQDGSYRLIVPAARAHGQQVSLVARSIGRRAQTATIVLASGDNIVRNFTLQADPLRLGEVVVTGAGTQSVVEQLGTARASVTGEDVQRANEPNLVTALAGKIPNVVINEASGDAGASTAIQIRGAKSFGTSQPIFVIDGVVVSNATHGGVLSGAPAQNRAADINPDDIESMEILKGAAAASIYGASAGSAGAILITTKRGHAGTTQWNFRSSYQADTPIRTVPFQRMYGVGSGGVSSQCTTTNCLINSSFFSWGPLIPAGTPTYDHAKEIYETGKIWDNNISASGGTERTTFYLSAGALNNNGFIVGDNDFLKRYTVRFNGSHRALDNLTIGASGSYVQTAASGVDRGNSINGLTLNAQRQPPDFNAKQYLDPVTGLHRSWRFPNPGPTAFATSRGFDNPFYAINQDDLEAQTGRFFGNVNTNWRPLSWVTLNWTLGGDYNGDDRTYAYAQASSGLNGGQIERWQFYDRIIDHNLTVTGTRSLTNAINATLTLGQNLNETYFRQVDVVGQTWIAPQPFKLANTVSRTVPSDAEQKRRADGYFGQLNLEMYDQLFLTGRLRNDGNSAFGVGHQRASYPGATAAWSFTKFFQVPEKFLSFGKVRAAYGESGQQPPLYATQDVFSTTAIGDFSPASIQTPTLNGIGGLYASGTKGNTNIKPERVREFESGVDLSLYHGKADLSVTNYNSKSEDVIFSVPLPPSTGYTSVNLNAGQLSNKGWEVTTSYRPIDRRDFGIELGGNWGRNRNLVTSLGAIDAQLQGTVPMPTAENCGPEAKVPRCTTGIGSSFSGQATFAQVGYPLGVWRSQDFARCGRGLTNVTFQGIVNNVGAACQGAPDGALYIAANGFPITDPTERAIGNPWPDWTAGINANVRVKGVTFSAFIDHRHGGDVLNMTRASMYQYGTHKDTEIRGQTRTFGQDMLCQNKTCDVLNGPVVGPGAGTGVVIGEQWFSAGALGGGQGATGGPITTRLEDATNTRLRELSIAYTFTQSWLQRVGNISAMDVKLSGRNLKLWTKYSGTDPETNLGGALNANRGIDWYNTPLTRGMVVSVSLHR